MGKLYTLKEAKELLGSLLRLFSVGIGKGRIRVVGTIGGGRIPEGGVKRILGLEEEL
jgi:hypothetical protein